MNGRRISVIVALVILVTGVPVAIWFKDWLVQRQAISRMAAATQTEKDRQRREVAQEVVLKQRHLEERRLAEAQRHAEQKRHQHEAELAQASLKQRQEEERRLAETVLLLESERQRQAELVQASLNQRQEEERKLAEARHQAERERQRREADLVQAALKQLGDDQSRLAEQQRHKREAQIMQAALKQQEAEQSQRAEAQRLAEQDRQRDAELMQATHRKKTAVNVGSKSAKRRTSRGRPAFGSRSVSSRMAKCGTPCRARADRRRGGASDGRYARVNARGHAGAMDFLCPLSWVRALAAELGVPLFSFAAERRVEGRTYRRVG